MEPKGYEVVTTIHLGHLCVLSVICFLLHDSVQFCWPPSISTNNPFNKGNTPLRQKSGQ